MFPIDYLHKHISNSECTQRFLNCCVDKNNRKTRYKSYILLSVVDEYI